MSIKIASAGNAGFKIRSDCEITLELKAKGGVSIDLSSKVKVLYGESITELCKEILRFFKIRNANLKIDDSGALPFVIAARLEAAIKKMIDSESEFLPVMLPENMLPSSAERTRFSRLYVPGNTPGMMINTGLHFADGIILDLEDSVAPEKKDEARILVRNALRQIDFHGSERMVRINQGDTGLKDLHSVIPQGVNMILIPKCETKDRIREVETEINAIRDKKKIRNHVLLMPIIESTLGIENSFEIAKSSKNIAAIAIGLEDFTSDLGVGRTTEGKESFYARTRLVNAAKAAGIQPIDSVFSDVADMESLKQNVKISKSLGFEGMGCIHPGQIAVINQGFAPEAEEIEKSKKIVLAFEEARKNGLSVVALGSKMIDPPVVVRAQKIISLAVRLGKLNDRWMEELPSEQA